MLKGLAITKVPSNLRLHSIYPLEKKKKKEGVTMGLQLTEAMEAIMLYSTMKSTHSVPVGNILNCFIA